jgi:SAM-dependent methyltransferase
MNMVKFTERNNIETSSKPKLLNQKIRATFLERTLRKIPRDKLILDLCCGYGFYFLINPEAQGIDGDPLCTLYLKEKGKIIPLANILDNLPYKNGCFSYVISHDVFEHFKIEDLETIFPEIHRILRPQGILVILVPNKKGYDFGIRIEIGHKTYITELEINHLIPGLFEIKSQYPEPLPRLVGKWFTHNKEVFILKKI